MSRPEGLASQLESLEALQDSIRRCTRCQDSGHLAAARPIRDGGRVSDRIMLVGQAPGARSDASRRHFTGPGGQVLEQWFIQAGFPPDYFRQRVYLTSLTRCFPGKHPAGKGDRVPSPAELTLCRPFLDAELALIEPGLIVLVGKLAIDTFLGRMALREVVGTLQEREGRLYLPLPHPSPVSRWLNDPDNRARTNQAIALLNETRTSLKLA